MRPTYANVMSTLALFVALGGTSYAAVTLKKGSVTSREVKDRSLQAVDLAPGVLSAGPSGARGPRGADGPQGATGPAGPSRVIFRERRGAATVGFDAGASVVVATIKLPAGRWIVEGDTEGSFFPNTSPGQEDVRCGLAVNGVVSVEKQAFLGNVPGASHFAPYALRQVVPLPSGGTIALRCWHPNSVPSGASAINFQKTTLTATEPSLIDAEDVTG